MTFLKQLRFQYGLSASKLADLLDTDALTIQGWENGDTIDPVNLKKLAILFEVDEADIIKIDTNVPHINLIEWY